MKTIRRPGTAFVILLGSFFFFLCIFSLLSSIIMPRVTNMVTAMRVLTLFQSIFLFIAPALITAITSTRLPARMLCIEHAPRVLPIGLILVILVGAIPVMNYIIEWNANIHLPASLHSLEEQIKAMEQAATDATNLLVTGDGYGTLIVAILIVGVMAGLSEELFFRGALQRILGSTSLGTTGAVWVAAFIFSFMHFQFYGFIPRVILGLFFGYILIWGNNLWYCVIAHAANNIMAVTVTWFNARSEEVPATFNLDTIGKVSDSSVSPLPVIIAGIVVVILGIYILRRELKKEVAQNNHNVVN